MPPTRPEILRQAGSFKDFIHIGTLILEQAIGQEVRGPLISTTRHWTDVLPPADQDGQWTRRETEAASALTELLPVTLASTLARATEITAEITSGKAVQARILGRSRDERRAISRNRDGRNEHWHELAGKEWLSDVTKATRSGNEPRGRAIISAVLTDYVNGMYPEQLGVQDQSQSRPKGIVDSVMAGVRKLTGSDRDTAPLSRYALGTMLGLAEYDLTRVWLEDTYTIAQVGTPGEALARRFWANGAARRVWTSDVPAKRAMMESVIAGYEELSGDNKVAQNQEQRLILESLTRHARASLEGFDMLLRNLQTLYLSFGYELPEALREPIEQEEAVAAASGTSVVATVVAVDSDVQESRAEPVHEVDPVVSAELNRRSSELVAAAEDFRSRWSWTERNAKGRKAYEGLTRSLRTGFLLADRTTLSAVFGNSQDIVGMLTRLNHIAARVESPETGAMRLAEAIARQDELVRSNRELAAWAGDQGAQYRGIDVYDIRGLISTISDATNWRTIHEAINLDGSWPANDGRIVPRIRALLDAYAVRVNSKAE